MTRRGFTQPPMWNKREAKEKRRRVGEDRMCRGKDGGK